MLVTCEDLALWQSLAQIWVKPSLSCPNRVVGWAVGFVRAVVVPKTSQALVGQLWGQGLWDSPGDRVSCRQELSTALLSVQMRGALLWLLLKCKSAAESNSLTLLLQLIMMQPHLGFSLFLLSISEEGAGVITLGGDRRWAFVRAPCECPGEMQSLPCPGLPSMIPVQTGPSTCSSVHLRRCEHPSRTVLSSASP